MSDCRLVVLVAVSSCGVILGKTEARWVSGVHWQDVARIADVFPGAMILRLLSVEPIALCEYERVVYLAQFDGESLPGTLNQTRLDGYSGNDPDNDPDSDRERRPEDRMPWADVNGPCRDLEWASLHVTISGPPVQYRTWNLSSVWCLPTANGNVWLKSVPDFFAHEGVVLSRFKQHGVVELIACEGHRMLMAEMPGVDGYRATLQERLHAIDCLVELQRHSEPLCGALKDDSVPALSLDALAEQGVELLLDRQPAHRHKAFTESVPHRLAILADSDMADVLVHGDFHSGNLRAEVYPTVLFDWGDSFIGHPLLDMASVRNARVLDHWLAAWQAHYPLENMNKLWEAIRPLARLRTALVYQHFMDNIEPSEQIYHDGDVDELLAVFNRCDN